MSNCCKENKDKCCGISKVVIPAALGDENGEYGPQNGAYFNTLVEYQASGVSYLYSNDGIPTRMGDGIVATIEVGETTTLQPGESATVENTGDKYHAVLNFGIPEGQKGDTGDAATIQVGTVTTLDPDQDATVVNSGTTSAAVFDFGIPKGDKGDTGSVSSEVVTELPVPGDDSKLYLMEKDPTVETADGAAFTIQNAATDGEMRLVEIDGNATQNGTPTPTAPVAVNTTTGENVVKITGKNLINENGERSSQYIDNAGNFVSGVANGYVNQQLSTKPNTAYTFSASSKTTQNVYIRIGEYRANGSFIKRDLISSLNQTITTDAECYILKTCIDVSAGNHFTNPQLELGSTATAYEPYQGQSHTIDLGSIELAKIGNYQDRIYKQDGKWYVEKQTGKIASYAGETISTDYISTTGQLTTGATVYYALATPTTTEITDSTLLSQLNFIANLYGGTNNIMLVGTGAQGEIKVEYQTWDKYNRYDVYIWNDEINDYQILNS